MIAPIHQLSKGMNQRRLTDLHASFIQNESKHPSGIRFACPVCPGNCWIEARWSDRESPRETIYQRAGITLEEITISPAIDTVDQRGCGIVVWIHDGEVIWS
jgi:hypothetical protein